MFTHAQTWFELPRTSIVFNELKLFLQDYSYPLRLNEVLKCTSKEEGLINNFTAGAQNCIVDTDRVAYTTYFHVLIYLRFLAFSIWHISVKLEIYVKQQNVN